MGKEKKKNLTSAHAVPLHFWYPKPEEEILKKYYCFMAVCGLMDYTLPTDF